MCIRDSPWTTTFFNDADFGIRTMIERWMNAINDLANGTGLVNPAAYQTDLFVQQLDRDNRILKNYRFINAWPTTLGAIDLNAEQATEIETFDVTWRYMHFLTSGVQAKRTQGAADVGSVSDSSPKVDDPALGVFASGIQKGETGLKNFKIVDQGNRGTARAQLGGGLGR